MFNPIRRFTWLIGFILFAIVFTACVPLSANLNASSAAISIPSVNLGQPFLGASATQTPAPVADASSAKNPSFPAAMGPELDQFPVGVNPLTGMPVADPALLDLPAILMSISNFPPSTRPQAGLSFAPQLFEIYIGEGMTRFLTVFYGEKAEYKDWVVGNLPVRTTPFVKSGVVVGNRVWHDTNKNGIQDLQEYGIGGVKVELLDADSRQVLDTMITDSNGFYGFNVKEDSRYMVKFYLPNKFSYSPYRQGGDSGRDSDVNATTGATPPFTMGDQDTLDLDAGMIAPEHRLLGSNSPAPGASSGVLIGDQVWLDINRDGIQNLGEHGFGGVVVNLLDAGRKVISSVITDYDGNYSFTVEADKSYYLQFIAPPGYSFSPRNVGTDEQFDSDPSILDGVTEKFKAGSADAQRWDAGLMPPYSNVIDIRSGRQAYAPLLPLYGPDSCLLAAGKSVDVQVKFCQNVYNYDSSNVNAAGVPTEKIPEIAASNKDSGIDPNYSGNLFDAAPPAGGVEASNLLAFWSYLNQEAFRYDPLSGMYLRFDDREADGVGELSPSYDRLTGKQLMYANVIILYVPHTKLNTAGTIIDLAFTSSKGPAAVFRNGKLYRQDVIWSTIAESYEKETSVARPIKIRYADGSPFPLAPGNTWFLVVTPDSWLWEAYGAGSWKMRFIAP